MSEIAVPEPKDDEVLIKISYVGICGSDIHAYFGQHPFISCPIVMGHEFSGTVVKIGSGVKGIAVGDKVTAMPQVFCKECEPCREGRYNICDTLKVLGCQTPGAACEYYAVGAELVKVVNGKLPLDLAATVEPAAVGLHAVRRAGSVAGKNVVVLGAGTIGNLAAQSAMAEGAKSVLISDLSDYRLGVAKECGIPFAVNSGKEDLGEAIRGYFRGEGADLFVECVGIGATVNQAISLSKKGNDIVVVGVFGKTPEINMSFVQDRELRLMGSLMYVEKDWDDVTEYLGTGRMNTRPLITRVFPFDEYFDAFKYIKANSEKSMKILTKVD
ncbi:MULTISPECIES: zinc-dependent alcohol dehydrogenase [Acutalibacteraceae]|uniref:zinc-dependent alcohol dehydrogenase n=1 Tax=Acutalibacteraceae TaxID=3082771 RepID=UPI0013E8C589|nr:MULTISPECIES: alcohol dehydrogenase catalytic domain-containing protein [Acutalibacteraceae]